MVPRCLALLAGATLLAVSLVVVIPAHAGPRRAPAVRLVYTRSPRAAGCPGAEALRRAAVKEMGYDPFQADASQELRVAIDRRGGELAVEMELRDGGGQLVWEIKSMRSRGDCGALVDALGLSLAIRLDPEPDPPALTCPPAPAAPPASACPVPEVKRAGEAREPASPAGTEGTGRPALLLGAGSLLALETPFAVAPGASVFAGARWLAFSLQLEARAVLPGAGGDPGASVSGSALTLLLAPGAHLGAFFGCGVVEGGLLVPRGMGLASAGIRLGVERALGRRLLIRGHADLLGTLARRQLLLQRDLVGYTPEVLGVLAIDFAALLFSAFPAVPGGVLSTPSTKGPNP